MGRILAFLLSVIVPCSSFGVVTSKYIKNESVIEDLCKSMIVSSSFDGKELYFVPTKNNCKLIKRDVYCFNLDAGELENITNTSDKLEYEVMVGEKYIAWFESSRSDPDRVVFMNRTTKNKKYIVRDSLRIRNVSYALSGEYFLYRKFVSKDNMVSHELWAYNIEKESEMQISQTVPYTHPIEYISDGRMVFYSTTVNKKNGSDIFSFNLETLEQKSVCTEVGAQKNLDLKGDILVWEDHRKGSWDSDIYGYRISEGLVFTIDTSRYCTYAPKISGNCVVYRAVYESPPDRKSTSYIYLADTSSNPITPIKLSSSETPKDNLMIDGDFLLWVDYKRKNRPILEEYTIWGYCVSDRIEFEAISGKTSNNWLVDFKKGIFLWSDSEDLNYFDKIHINTIGR